MPVRQGGRLVELTPDIVKALNEYLEEGRRPEPDFTKLINAILENVVAKEEFLKDYIPNLDVLATKESSIYIQDKTTRKVYEVTVNGNIKVECLEDKTDQCEHARYFIAMTEFGKIVRRRLPNNTEK